MSECHPYTLTKFKGKVYDAASLIMLVKTKYNQCMYMCCKLV